MIAKLKGNQIVQFATILCKNYLPWAVFIGGASKIKMAASMADRFAKLYWSNVHYLLQISGWTDINCIKGLHKNRTMDASTSKRSENLMRDTVTVSCSSNLCITCLWNYYTRIDQGDDNFFILPISVWTMSEVQLQGPPAECKSKPTERPSTPLRHLLNLEGESNVVLKEVRLIFRQNWLF